MLGLSDDKLSNNKLSGNNLASEFVEKKEFFKPITIELIVVFMINMYIWHRVQFLSYPL